MTALRHPVPPDREIARQFANSAAILRTIFDERAPDIGNTEPFLAFICLFRTVPDDQRIESGQFPFLGRKNALEAIAICPAVLAANC